MRGLILAGMLAATGCGQQMETPSERAAQAAANVRDQIAETDTEIELAKPWPKWLVSLDTSPITDDPSVQVTTQSQKLDGPFGYQRATLMVLCNEKTPALVITWPKGLKGRGRVEALFRFDDAPAKAFEPLIATDDTGFGWWGWKAAQPVLDQILAADRLVVRATAIDGTTMDAEFNVTSLGAHMPKIDGACPK